MMMGQDFLDEFVTSRDGLTAMDAEQFFESGEVTIEGIDGVGNL